MQFSNKTESGAFRAGILLHTGPNMLPQGDRLLSAPIDTLWRTEASGLNHPEANRAALAVEAARLDADEVDQSEMLAVAELMESIRVRGSRKGQNRGK